MYIKLRSALNVLLDFITTVINVLCLMLEFKTGMITFHIKPEKRSQDYLGSILSRTVISDSILPRMVILDSLLSGTRISDSILYRTVILNSILFRTVILD